MKDLAAGPLSVRHRRKPTEDLVLADFHRQLDFDWPAARREMARALELDPASPIVRVRNAATVLMPENRLEEAIAQIELALDLDPLSASARAWLGIMLLFARDDDRAIDEARHMLEVEPTSCWGAFHDRYRLPREVRRPAGQEQ